MHDNELDNEVDPVEHIVQAYGYPRALALRCVPGSTTYHLQVKLRGIDDVLQVVDVSVVSNVWVQLRLIAVQACGPNVLSQQIEVRLDTIEWISDY